jgi:RNA polymerase sigma-70 factor, ECF subfamily
VPTTFTVRQSEPAAAAKNGPDELYREASLEYGPAFERLAYAYEADSDRRRDLLQEIHFQLWRSFEKFDARCSLRTWIYRVAHNVATSHVVRQRRNRGREFVTLEEIESKPNQEDLEISADRQRVLTKLLTLVQKLEPVDRQLILGYLEGLDAESLGEITGLSTANVWTKLHRIKNILTRQFNAGGRDAS